MDAVELAYQSQLKNIQTKTGKTLDQLYAMIRKSGLTRHGEIRDLLKRDLALGHGDANSLAKFYLQHALHAEPWGDAVVRVRMGLHTGSARARPDGDYDGYLTLATVQRVISTAHGGQTLVSNATAALLSGQPVERITLRELAALERLLFRCADPEWSEWSTHSRHSHRCRRTLPTGQDYAADQDQNVLPNCRCEMLGELRQDFVILAVQGNAP